MGKNIRNSDTITNGSSDTITERKGYMNRSSDTITTEVQNKVASLVATKIRRRKLNHSTSSDHLH